MKKLLLSLTTSLAIVTPIATVLSCGSSSSNDEENNNFQEFKVINDSKDVSPAIVDVIKKHFYEYVNEFAEGQALKAIHIFDVSNAPYRGDEGDYLPESNELIINTEIMSKYTNFKDDDKANYIMQLLAHEYNHFVDHSYLLSIDPNSSLVSNEVYDWNNNGKVQPWPSQFLADFKRILKYNDDTKLYQGIEVSNGFKSLGSLYNQKNLFDMANGATDPSTLYSKLKGNEVMAPISPKVPVNSSRVITKGALSYIYSMDELFARKMQIITSKYWKSTSFDEEGYFTTGTGSPKLESPYLQDVVNYQRGLNDFGDDGQYLFDKPTQELATLYDKVRGVDFAPISFTEVKNDKHITSSGTFEGTIDRNQIRFGGAIDDVSNSKLEYIGYLNDGTFINIPITIKTRTNKGLSTRDYLTNFIKATDIVGKELYFAESSTGANKIKIIKTRDVTYGKVSTHRYLDPEHTQNYEFNKKGILQTL